MKKLNVIVKDKNTLVLDEDGSKGDYIDLSNLASVDFSQIEAQIEEAKDKVYEAKLSEFKRSLLLEEQVKDSKLKAQYEQSLVELERKYLEKINELNNKLENAEGIKEKALLQEAMKHQELLNNTINAKNDEINSLKNSIKELKDNQALLLENNKLSLSRDYDKKLADLESKLNNKDNETAILLGKKDLEHTNLVNTLKNEYELKLTEKENAYLALQRQKASLNVKQTGEDLESWCNNEMRSYRQTGLFNTTWAKDNDVIREDGETKGSKADYIFKIYATNELKESEELASVCLEMKDENPDSVNKQTNEHYFNQLEKNRKKKNCKYAVLVSNLETDKPNDLPIWKAEGYDDMYVVRPAYMMSFLSMLTSLTTRFRDLLLENNQERLELLSQFELKEKFEALKNTYLDKPLENLSKSIETIREQANKMKDISNKIEAECDKATRTYLNEIQNKLNKFELEIDKAYRKFDRENK